ncbi:MAG: hypothetical protein AB4050_10800 [Synechococcus sp.]
MAFSLANQLSKSAIAAVVAVVSISGRAVPVVAQLPPEPDWRPVNPQPLPSNELPFALQAALLRAGDTLGATFVDDDTLYFDPRETRAASLYIRSDVFDASGNVAIPSGTLITGQFQPVEDGTQFIADSLVLGDRAFPLLAQSQTIESQRDPRQVSAGAIAQDAAIGAGIGLVLSAVTGDRAIATEEVLGAAALGAVVGNVTAPEAIAIPPDTDINLTVTADFQAVN